MADETVTINSDDVGTLPDEPQIPDGPCPFTVKVTGELSDKGVFSIRVRGGIPVVAGGEAVWGDQFELPDELTAPLKEQFAKIQDVVRKHPAMHRQMGQAQAEITLAKNRAMGKTPETFLGRKLTMKDFTGGITAEGQAESEKRPRK